MSVDAASDTAPPVFQPLDLYRLAWAAAPAVSPDGAQVAYLLNAPDRRTDRVAATLKLRDLASGAERVLAGPETSPSRALWSPDGSRLAFLGRHEASPALLVARADGAGRMRLDGGRHETETDQNLAWNAGSVRAFAWAPDGRSLALLVRVASPNYRPAAMPAPSAGEVWAPDAIYIGHTPYRSELEGPLPETSLKLLLVGLDGAARLVCDGIGEPAEPALIFTPGGEEVILAASDGALFPRVVLEAVSLADGARRVLTPEAHLAGQPALSPDGAWLAYIAHLDTGAPYGLPRLHLRAMAGGGVRRLAADLDRPLHAPQWRSDGSGLYVFYEDGGLGKVGYVDLADRFETLVEAVGAPAIRHPYVGGDVHVGGDVIAYTTHAADRPPALGLWRAGRDEGPLEDLNPWLGALDLGETEAIAAVSPDDGVTISGWLLRPPHFDPGRRYPLVLEIHGGPWAAYGPRFSVCNQLYAAAGYCVLLVNPRGSTGYGEAFAQAINQAFPGRDYDDLMSVLDVAAGLEFIDSDALYVTGGSGGGTLTAWAVGASDRFRAAASVKPLINPISWRLTNDMQGALWTRYWFRAPPWRDPEASWALSPLSRAHQVRTPTLVICGESDLRTPIAESEQLFQALKECGVETALVRLPEANHSGGRPSQWLAHYLYALDWFARHRP
ncbi:MAG: S9 family peptidase [Caulobacteraceae bacterium]|nr:S9 family peptidase [Caulobacteraceae bacterium]